jgi:EAL domain-containing protein (putative c-di-GMP-specific phosphodiesterase class I)
MYLGYELTKTALLSGDICLHYQPIHSLETGEIDGYEALARWGLMPPPSIAAAIEYHNLQSLWLQQQVAQVNAVLDSLPPHIWISLNINQSALQIDGLPAILNATPEPSRIVIEVLEAVRLDSKTAEALGQLHCTHLLKADDIGSLEYGWIDRLVGGYAALFDGLKLCRGLTYDVHCNSRTALVCAAMLTISAELNLTTCAEWVHHPDQRDWLQQRGCNSGQGQLYGMPVPWLPPSPRKNDLAFIPTLPFGRARGFPPIS